MASLDSANGPSDTVRPVRLETILPSRSSGWPALHFPCRVSRSNQAYHWPTIFWISSGERSLSQCVPRNRSMYPFCVSVFIVAFPFAVLPVQRYNKQTGGFRTFILRLDSFPKGRTYCCRRPGTRRSSPSEAPRSWACRFAAKFLDLCDELVHRRHADVIGDALMPRVLALQQPAVGSVVTPAGVN